MPKPTGLNGGNGSMFGNGQGPGSPSNGSASGGSRPHGQGNGSAPPRLKAKPKRSSPDPLQDFQQRQAS
ncbi:MAG: hypothetical protein JNL80_10805 [Phycisphaerae bacterium]|jgi:hypothetical protein|nr:hypothetical protein [Phycisphaerae bacterium]